MRKIIFLAFIVSIFVTCKKGSTSSNDVVIDLSTNVENINQMVVPSGFNYPNSNLVNIQVDVSNGGFESQLKRIDIYDGNPYSNGNLLASGSASFSNSYRGIIYLPRAVDQIYVVRTNPDKSSTFEIVPITSNNIIVYALGKKGVELNKSMPASPDCNTGCTSTVTGNNNINLNNAASVVCVTGNFSGGIDINRGTVRICGNATISNLSMNNNSNLLIAAGAVVTVSNFNINGSSATFSNWSNSVTINSGFSPGGVVNNYGTIAVNGTFNINGQATITNHRTITVNGSLNNNKTFINNGTLTVTGSFAQNGGGVFTNNCNFTIGQDANINNPITNNNYIKVVGATTINGGGVVNMVNGAMWLTSNMTVNGTITGTSTTSLVKVTANTTINGGGNISGALQYCDLNGIETNTGTIAPSVSRACNLYIPVTSCNPDGNGAIVIPDTDGDGANDTIDEYPNDPLLAFNNYYPNKLETATAAFEDLWPSKGDYDLNDLVIDFRHNMVTNAQNKIAKYVGYYKLRASGGAQKIAFCMKFPLGPTIAQNLTGATQESGHDKLVFQLFANSKNELSSWNTVMLQPKSDPVEYNVSFTVANGPTLASIGGVTSFDPFIWMNETNKGRGYEIHTPGNSPTALVNSQLFGYADDDTDANRAKYYLTKNNLPWGIIVPKSFDYCQELTQLGLNPNPDITQVYLHFAQWAQSGGQIYKDWYEDKEGYRNTNYIYTK